MNKLLLEEEDLTPEEDLTENTVNSVISNLIQEKWKGIDLLNGNIIMLQQYNVPNVIAVLESMVSDNYIHIGQLEKLLEVNSNEASNIEAGKNNIDDTIKATDKLDTVEVEVPEVK